MITIDSKILKAAQLFQAKDDPRFYLKGIYLNNKHGRIEATDGHTALIVDCENLREMESPAIICIHGSIPARAGKAYIEILDDKKGFITFENKESMLAFSIIKGKYVDINRVLPKQEDKEPVHEIGVNSSYVVQVQKASDILSHAKLGIKLEFYGQSKTIRAVINSAEFRAIALIMPMRL